MRRSRWPSHLVLFLSVSVTLAAALTIYKLSGSRERAKFNQVSGQWQHDFERGLNKYLTLLDSVRALAVAKVSMTSTQFQGYVDALNLRANYQGIVGLGVALKIPSTQKEELIKKASAQGLPEFHIWPPSDLPEMCPLVLLEPRDERNLASLGHDLFAELGLRDAALTAAETGNPTATTAMPIDSPAANSNRIGFHILAPVYRGGGFPATLEERRTNVAGFVQYTFETQSLFRDIVDFHKYPGFKLRIFDGDTAIYESSERVDPPVATHLSGTNQITVAERPWNLVFASDQSLGSVASPVFRTLLVGLIFSALLWAISLGQIRAREAAERHVSEIGELNARLEQRVVERTAELERAVDDLKSFSYSVSHDLRAPLRHIDGYVNLLREQPGIDQDPKAQRLAGIISDSARQMGNLIDALLAFSQLGRVNLSISSRVNVNELVREIRKIFLNEVGNRVIDWQIGELPEVTADRTLLGQVFANLISNAIKYSASRSPAVIQIGSEDRGHEILFLVRDNGVGFDMRYVDKLFGVFQRLHPEEHFEGTGIGLANIRKIVTRHGGRTWAEGALGHGATFFFTLPKKSETPLAKEI